MTIGQLVNFLSIDSSMNGRMVSAGLPAVGHGGVRDQHRADWSDPHALVDDAVQVRQPAAVWRTHWPLTAHMLIQLLLHALLDLEGAGHSGRPYDKTIVYNQKQEVH